IAVRLPYFFGEPIVRATVNGGVGDAESVTEGAALAVVQASDGDQSVFCLVHTVIVVTAARGDVLRPQLRRFFISKAAGPRLRQRRQESFTHGPIDILDREQRTVLSRQAGGEETGLDALTPPAGGPGEKRVDDAKR